MWKNTGLTIDKIDSASASLEMLAVTAGLQLVTHN